MTPTQLDIELPEGLSGAEAKALLAVKLLELEKVSLGEAARISGYSKRAFMELLSLYRIPVFDYPAEDLSREIE